MDISLSEEVREMQSQVRRYMQGPEVGQWIEEARRTHAFPHAFMEEMAQLGFLGMTTSDQYVGLGMSYAEALAVFEEIAYWSTPFSLNILVQNSLAEFPIEEFGSFEQRNKYLPRMVRGELYGCFANSEPGAGSDAKNISTRAEYRDGKWIINGEKHFITSAVVSGIAVLFARTSPRLPGHPGITAFLVELGPNTPGVSVVVQPKNAQHGSMLCRITLEHVEVPDTRVLGEVDQGWKVCERTFLHSRLWIAMQGVGAARRALDETISYASQRSTFGKSIIEHQAIGFELAKTALAIDAARLLTLRAADMEMKEPDSPNLPALAAMAKYAGTEAAQTAALQYYRYCGGLSVTAEWPAAGHLLDSLVLPIYEGPNEIQLAIIANHLRKNV